MLDLESFRERLRNRRKELNMTQAQLGEACGISAQEISHFETGRRTPELEMFLKLCNALETSPNMLLWDYFESASIPYPATKSEELRIHVRNALKELTELDDYISY